MKAKLIHICFIFFALLSVSGCSAKKNHAARVRVPIGINITTEDNNYALDFINTDLYRFKVLDIINNFQDVDFELVDVENDPEVTIDLTITTFQLLPKSETSSQRTFSRTVQVGTDQSGKPIMQVISASVTLVQSQIKSFGSFLTKIAYKKPGTTSYRRTFSASYNWSSVRVENVQGDSRAVDPGIYAMSMPDMEPIADDFLLALSTQGMLQSIRDELDDHFYKPRIRN